MLHCHSVSSAPSYVTHVGLPPSPNPLSPLSPPAIPLFSPSPFLAPPPFPDHPNPPPRPSHDHPPCLPRTLSLSVRPLPLPPLNHASSASTSPASHSPPLPVTETDDGRFRVVRTDFPYRNVDMDMDVDIVPADADVCYICFHCDEGHYSIARRSASRV